jgi:hypothetical protein
MLTNFVKARQALSLQKMMNVKYVNHNVTLILCENIHNLI